MKKPVSFLLMTVLATMLVACARDTAQTPAVDDQSSSAETAPAGGTPSAGGEAMEGLLSETRVYFAFDSSALDEQGRSVVEAHAAHLSRNSNLSVTLEGHADERGTREYNLALGERRAQSVQRLMQALGVSSRQIRVVSYGEEKPAVRGHDESAYRQNRRVEIVYR